MRPSFSLPRAAAVLGGLAATAGAAPEGIVYAFAGKLRRRPRAATSRSAVETGTPPALRAMIGKSAEQAFSYGDSTQFSSGRTACRRS